MKKYFPAVLFLIMVLMSACRSNTSDAKSQSVAYKEQVAERKVGGPCECCEAWRDGIPNNLSGEMEIAPDGEPGEPLEVSGVIYESDGTTPAAGVILYVYHTDAEGNYSRGPDFSNCARRHGLLRGWMKTDKTGRYSFRTIRPASYPNTTVEQHIHAIVKEPGLSEYWIDSYHFEDDPNLPDRIRNKSDKRGGSGLMKVVKNDDGIWTGQRDIILGRGVDGYQ